ncbi:MAG: iron-containing alcohol dehydrogenase, partial [Rhodobacteraceae bacterium]|nr:iron-containing alcohol dehydrogenase [Paracoccaceae bacterium]
MIPFAIHAPPRILFGRGQARQAGPAIAAYGRRVLLIHGANPARADGLAGALAQEGCALTRIACAHEPDLPLLEKTLEVARDRACDLVVSLGGGAAIDLGKAIAALAPQSTPPLDHLEAVGPALPLLAAPLPFVALPTTAGTGAEVTWNAVIDCPAHRRKVSLRDARMVARLAIIDPALTDHCPRAVTLASGLDAITQVIEPYLTPRATPYTDALCEKAIPSGLAALRRLMQAEDREARDQMAWVSLSGGLALANAGLGAVHGLA